MFSSTVTLSLECHLVSFWSETRRDVGDIAFRCFAKEFGKWWHKVLKLKKLFEAREKRKEFCD